MTPTELRNNLKATLDKAVQGEVIIIKRAGQTFELRAVFPNNTFKVTGPSTTYYDKYLKPEKG